MYQIKKNGLSMRAWRVWDEMIDATFMRMQSWSYLRETGTQLVQKLIVFKIPVCRTCHSTHFTHSFGKPPIHQSASSMDKKAGGTRARSNSELAAQEIIAWMLLEWQFYQNSRPTFEKLTLITTVHQSFSSPFQTLPLRCLPDRHNR